MCPRPAQKENDEPKRRRTSRLSIIYRKQTTVSPNQGTVVNVTTVLPPTMFVVAYYCTGAFSIRREVHHRRLLMPGSLLSPFTTYSSYETAIPLSRVAYNITHVQDHTYNLSPRATRPFSHGGPHTTATLNAPHREIPSTSTYQDIKRHTWHRDGCSTAPDAPHIPEVVPCAYYSTVSGTEDAKYAMNCYPCTYYCMYTYYCKITSN